MVSLYGNCRSLQTFMLIYFNFRLLSVDKKETLFYAQIIRIFLFLDPRCLKPLLRTVHMLLARPAASNARN